MKITGVILIVLSISLSGVLIWRVINANYEWSNSVLSNWTLADKSSTLEAKSGYIDKFVQALQSNNLADNNALIYKTADNNCQNNIQAVSTLKDRLNQIKGMDETSFQYQQAIQQITAQEQGQADDMISALHGCWLKTHHYFLWNVFTAVGMFAGLILMLFVGVGFATLDDY